MFATRGPDTHLNYQVDIFASHSSIISTTVLWKWEHQAESQETWIQLATLPPLNSKNGHFITGPQFLHQ